MMSHATAIDIALRDYHSDEWHSIEERKYKAQRFERTIKSLRQRIRVQHDDC